MNSISQQEGIGSQPNAFGGFSGKVGCSLALSKKHTPIIFYLLLLLFLILGARHKHRFFRC